LLGQDLARAGESESVKGKGIPLDEKCPRCGRPLVIREGRFGRFKACSGYPECKHKESLTKVETTSLEETCPTCGAQLVRRKGKYGFFVACSDYPKCRYIKKEKTEKKEMNIPCPLGCGGMILQRKTRRGRIFYGCSRFPKCRFATWNEPVDRPCPRCGKPVLLRKVVKDGTQLSCRDETCGYSEKTAGAAPDKESGEGEARTE
jgi:DNA topoisomerase-1